MSYARSDGFKGADTPAERTLAARLKEARSILSEPCDHKRQSCEDVGCRYPQDQKILALLNDLAGAAALAAVRPTDEKDERDLTIFRNMEATNAHICWECREVRIRSGNGYTLRCEKCDSSGYVLPFVVRPAEAREPVAWRWKRFGQSAWDLTEYDPRTVPSGRPLVECEPLYAAAAPQAEPVAPGMTDLMVTPESLDEYLDPPPSRDELVEWVLMYDEAIAEGTDADAVYMDMVRCAKRLKAGPVAGSHELRERIANELREFGILHPESRLIAADKILALLAPGEPQATAPRDEGRTIGEWCASGEFSFTVIDPDGFDRKDPLLMERKFTREEFEQGALGSTCLVTGAGTAPQEPDTEGERDE